MSPNFQRMLVLYVTDRRRYLYIQVTNSGHMAVSAIVSAEMGNYVGNSCNNQSRPHMVI